MYYIELCKSYISTCYTMIIIIFLSMKEKQQSRIYIKMCSEYKLSLLTLPYMTILYFDLQFPFVSYGYNVV